MFGEKGVYTDHMNINEATAMALSAERSAAHMTIKRLAEESGIPERTLIRILKGERDINVLQIARACAVLGLYPHELIEEAEKYMERSGREERATWIAAHPDLIAKAAKTGDTDAEQAAYEEQP